MSATVEPLTPTNPSNAFKTARKAQALLAQPVPSSDFFPLSLLKTAETPDTWSEYERLFYACLETENDQSAHQFLERLTNRFGGDNERIIALRGLYQEAVAKSERDLGKVLADYNSVLRENPLNVAVHKRRIALIRSMKQYPEAIAALVDFLDSFPTDVEAWCELADLYQCQGMSSQAIFCLEEGLLGAPQAWNLHARLGELECIAAASSADGAETTQQLLIDAVQRFSRSIELCDGYLRGYYGLHVSSGRLLQLFDAAKGGASAKISRETLQRLHQLAHDQLASIVQKWSRDPISNIEESEIIASRALLDRTTA